MMAGEEAGSVPPRRHIVGMTKPSPEHPEPAATPLVSALRHGLRGDWKAAHDIVQADDGADAVWVHAWLHRIEGDEFNAAYWYRRAGRAVGRGSTQDEGEAILQALSRAAG
jgi:hypothetical protein